MGKSAKDSVDEIVVDFSKSSQKKTKKWGIIFGSLLMLFLVLGFTLRTPPKLQLPALTKVNEGQETSLGTLYYIETTYDASKNQAESLYYLDAPQTDSALSTKVRCQVQSAYGNFLSSKVYQAGAHTFAITYHPDKKNMTTTQQISIKNLSKVNDGGSTQEDVLTTVIKPNQNVSGWTPPTFKSLVQSGTNYQIERLNQSIERKKAQIETKTKKIKQAQQSIQKISNQDKSNLTSDQLNANQTQLDALNGEVESQTTAIQTIKSSLETEEGNLEKAQRILKAIKTSSNDQEIADALG